MKTDCFLVVVISLTLFFLVQGLLAQTASNNAIPDITEQSVTVILPLNSTDEQTVSALQNSLNETTTTVQNQTALNSTTPRKLKRKNDADQPMNRLSVWIALPAVLISVIQQF